MRKMSDAICGWCGSNAARGSCRGVRGRGFSSTPGGAEEPVAAAEAEAAAWASLGGGGAQAGGLPGPSPGASLARGEEAE